MKRWLSIILGLFLVICMCQLTVLSSTIPPPPPIDPTPPPKAALVELSATPLRGYAPLTVKFEVMVFDTLEEICLDFGDGSPVQSVAGAVTHIYQSSGTYTATVTATGGGLTCSDVQTITVLPNQPPVVSLAAIPVTGIAPLTVSFTATASDPNGDPLSYSWNFGDGSPVLSGAASMSHTYQNAGTYTAIVTVSDGKGGSCSASKTITVTPNHPPTVTLTADPVSGLVPLTVNFTVTVSDLDGDPLSYSWNFGDGSPVQTGGATAPHTYQDFGPYTATVTVNDGRGGSSSASKTITVFKNHPPTVSLSASPLSGRVPLTVNFTATASDQDGDSLSYSWNFDDGTPVQTGGPSVSHTFRNPRHYVVMVTVYDTRGGFGRDSEPILVNPNQPPTVRLAASPDSGRFPLTVNFTATGSDPENDPLSYRWNFGDGTPVQSGGETISHIYQNIGTYKAEVTVNDGQGGSASIFKTIYVTPNCPPAISLTASPTSGVNPVTVNFSATASDPENDPLSYRWDFGDGSPVQTGGATMSHIYNMTSTATVTVNDGHGGSSRASQTITVTPNHPPAVTLTANPSSGHLPLTVNFTATASDPDNDPLSYSWNFGDGSSTQSEGATASHIYRNEGTYTATVIVSDGRGALASAVQTITVTPNHPPTVTLTPANSSGVVPVSKTFTAEAQDPDGDPLVYYWNFGDGSSYYGAYWENHTYSSAGHYNVSVRVSDGVNSVSGSAVFHAYGWVGDWNENHGSNLRDSGISGNLYYGVYSEGLRIYDISGVGPQPAATISLGDGNMWGADICGNYAYFVGYWLPLYIYDTSNPAAPLYRGKTSTSYCAWNVTVSGNYAYICGMLGELYIVDISNPASPVEVGGCRLGPQSYYDIPCYGDNIVIRGSYAYITMTKLSASRTAESRGLRVVNISNPAAPVVVGVLDGLEHPTYAIDNPLALKDDYLFMITLNGVDIINIANPAGPYLINYIGVSHQVWDLELVGNELYFADSCNTWGGFYKIDVADPLNPAFIYQITDPRNANPWELDLEIRAGGYLYLNDPQGFSVYYVSDQF